MTEMELYKLWCEKAVDDPDLQTELKLSLIHISEPTRH